MTEQHTPWTAVIEASASYLDGIECSMLVRDAKGSPVAYCFDKDQTHLIAAAPNMLAALRAAAQAIGDCHNYRSHLHFKELTVIRNAIAKATGAA